MSTRPAERVGIILCRLTKTGSCKFVLSRRHVPKVRFGSWSCKNALLREVGEKPRPVLHPMSRASSYDAAHVICLSVN